MNQDQQLRLNLCQTLKSVEEAKKAYNFIDLLQHQQVEVEGCFMHYPAAHDIAKQIMQLLNNKKMTSK